MTSSGSAGERPHGTQPGRTEAADLAATLHHALKEAVRRLRAVSAAVYLFDNAHGGLGLAAVSGSPPSLFTFPVRMRLGALYASARAFALRETATLSDPVPADPADQGNTLPYPYISLSAPVSAAERRFGAITTLRLETHDNYQEADHAELQGIADALARALGELTGKGAVIEPGPMPMLAPRWFDPETNYVTPGWGVPGVPGSAGISMMYPVRRLAELLNQAMTMDDIVEAAQYCVMLPLRAQALVLTFADDGRLWVLGHSGKSSGLVRTTHGVGRDAQVPAARASRGRPLFFPDGQSSLSDEYGTDSLAEAYLPLAGNTGLLEFSPLRSGQVVGVCCLSFQGPRAFPPEERAIMTMLAGLLGAAVKRVALSVKQHEVAECLQRFLLPSALPDSPRLTTTARYRATAATSKVGGDWYDVIKLPDERMVLVVGDVEGHGMDSAAVMGQVRTAVAAYASEGHSPTTVIDRTSTLLAALGTDLIVTCCVIVLDTVDGTAQVASAGHPLPLVRRPNGTAEVMTAPSNIPLGVSTSVASEGWEHNIEPGSVLMLYTDGLIAWDAPDPQAQALALLDAGGGEAEEDLEQLADRMTAEMTSPQRHRDDAVLLLVRYEGCSDLKGQRAESLHIQQRDLPGVKAARTFVDEQLAAWGLREMSDTCQLVTSEIVTNALIHAGSDVDVRLRAFDDHIRLEVRDAGSNPPVPSPLALAEEENAEAEHGRGLLIVEALGGKWRSSPNGRGKTVLLDLPIEVSEEVTGDDPGS
ncbi:SpoIIE family protein phosphatase [Streptomyces sp. NBC_00887]|uniref:SpoIIE family protein phosphatase n=1 Tax=Streptomyces sp. NBC_00887 TaxID=2975859 RepID=UPI00386EF1BB|nr:SpoIIE family protein phosphatase [Streptomyces sp. NBC_00887]WSY36249.1 SpoIIE family protein phosphatase [Streptomyces sp. NBC_00887]